MATEGATHIDDLDIAKPDGSTEQVESLDDYHIQIKTVLQRDVNNFPGTAIVYGADTTNTDTYAFTSKRTITTYTAGIVCVLNLTGGNANTAAASVNIDGLGAKTIVTVGGAALTAGMLGAGINVLVYNGTNFILAASPIVDINGGTIDGAAITGSTIDGGTIGGTTETTVTKAALGTAVTAVTQAATENSTKVASTAFVHDAIEAGTLTHSGTNFTSTTATLGEATNIPTTANQIVVSFADLSTVGSGQANLEVGESGGGYTNSGYVVTGSITDSTGTIPLRSTNVGSAVYRGVVTLTRIHGTEQWMVNGMSARGGATITHLGGYITITGATAEIKITVAGGDTFDAGTASVYWQ